MHFYPQIYNDINSQFIHQLRHENPQVHTLVDRAHWGTIFIVSPKQTDGVGVKSTCYLVDERGLLRKVQFPVNFEHLPSCALIKDKLNAAQTIREENVYQYIIGEPISDICAVVIV